MSKMKYKKRTEEKDQGRQERKETFSYKMMSHNFNRVI